MHFNIGFMDALSDPKGYLSAQEKEQAKRAEALAKIGIDETEIDTTNVKSIDMRRKLILEKNAMELWKNNSSIRVINSWGTKFD